MALGFVNGIKDAVSSVEKFLDSGRGISALRNVDWDRKYLWLIEFEKSGIVPPSPFNDWFPASTVTVNDTSQSKEEFKFGQVHLAIPTGQSSAPTMSITFYDDVNRILQKWFTDWIKLDIQNNGEYISGLDDTHIAESSDSFGVYRNVSPVRAVNLIYLNLDRSNFKVKKYYIVPDGEFSKELSQASEAMEYTLSFNIVGEGVGTSGSVDNSLINTAKDLLNRLI